MITAVSFIVAVTLTANPSLPQWPLWPSACGYAAQLRGLNFPVNSASPKTDITHSAAIEWGGEPVGWLFQTAEGRVYYQDGPIDPSFWMKKQNPDVSKTVLSFLGLKSGMRIQEGTIYAVTGPLSISKVLSGSKIVIHACY